MGAFGRHTNLGVLRPGEGGVNRLDFAQGSEVEPSGAAAVVVTPGRQQGYANSISAAAAGSVMSTPSRSAFAYFSVEIASRSAPDCPAFQ